MKNSQPVLTKTIIIVMLMVLFYSCDNASSSKTDDWSQAKNHSGDNTMVLQCGKTDTIQLSKGDTLILYPRGTIAVGQCFIKAVFSHHVKGKLQSDSDYPDSATRVIQYDSTLVALQCLPQQNEGQCTSALSTRPK